MFYYLRGGSLIKLVKKLILRFLKLVTKLIKCRKYNYIRSEDYLVIINFKIL